MTALFTATFGYCKGFAAASTSAPQVDILDTALRAVSISLLVENPVRNT